MAALCVIWCIWRERNARLFEDNECSVDGARKNMISMLYLWVMAHHRVEIPNIEEFLICVLCIFRRGYIVHIFSLGLTLCAFQ
jgi:hypothetical protein